MPPPPGQLKELSMEGGRVLFSERVSSVLATIGIGHDQLDAILCAIFPSANAVHNGLT